MSVIITCNAGSTNIKLAAFDAKTLERKGHIITHHNKAEAIEWLCSIGSLGVAGISHRVVHGGHLFSHPMLVTNTLLEKLQGYIPLAPLHQPSSLDMITETQKLYHDIPQIACFDTSFHHTISDIQCKYPLPEWYYKEGIRRYGFHGLSYQYIASKLPAVAPHNPLRRVIVAHLGGGSSACAMLNLQSVDTTMGFSTLDGMMMGTRSGSIDPGVILYLLNKLEMKTEEITRLLYLESGLLGVSGFSYDMKDLLASTNPKGAEAVELYCYLAAKQIASLIPSIGGLDALVFTGGIGENAAEIRDKITHQLYWINDFETFVIPTNEELVLAESCKKLIG